MGVKEIVPGEIYEIPLTDTGPGDDMQREMRRHRFSENCLACKAGIPSHEVKTHVFRFPNGSTHTLRCSGEGCPYCEAIKGRKGFSMSGRISTSEPASPLEHALPAPREPVSIGVLRNFDFSAIEMRAMARYHELTLDEKALMIPGRSQGTIQLTKTKVYKDNLEALFARQRQITEATAHLVRYMTSSRGQYFARKECSHE